MIDPALHAPALEQANHALGVERGGPPPSPEFSEDDPRDTHESHRMVPDVGGRWLVCARCAARDYWPASEALCRVPEETKGVHLLEAIGLLRADLAAFMAWWQGTEEPQELPSADEWAANFLEWRIAR